MREYLLYVKETDGCLKAYVTPCFALDKQFWEQQDGERLRVVGTCPSLALAFALREEVNRWLRGKRPTEKAVWQAQKLAEAYAEETAALYVRESGGSDHAAFTFQPAGTDRGGQAAPMPENRAMPAPQPFVPEAGGGRDPGMQPQAFLAEAVSGRALLWEELENLAQRYGVPADTLPAAIHQLVLKGQAEWRPGVSLHVRTGWWKRRLAFHCERCGSGAIRLAACFGCRQGCAYCESCLHMGRSKCCTPYICMPVPGEGRRPRPAAGRLLQWQGRFSPWQQAAAEAARQFAAEPVGQAPAGRSFLIWAVCGAGKTELIFPAVEEALLQGGRVLIATPRKDVVGELVPRIKQAFPAAKVLGVHGASEEKWEDGDIVVSTTHQVLRCYRRFPLAVIDEVDAFPYHNNPMLHRAVERAATEGGKILYLSATPPEYLKRRLVRMERRGLSGKVPSFRSATHVLIPRRFHGGLLPVPRAVTVSGLAGKIRAGRPVPALLDVIERAFYQERRVFVFVPRVEDVPAVLRYIQDHRPQDAALMAGVHAADPEREEKVLAFRDHRLKLLVTTTILERGVTVPRSDVIVVGADVPPFDEASLVQIAGRVGRSADAPEGTVLFLQHHRSQVPLDAIRHIREMNRLARRGEEGVGSV